MQRRTFLWIACLASSGLAVGALADDAGLIVVAPADAGFDATMESRVDEVVATALESKKLPGCVVLIGRGKQIALRKAYGHRQLLPAELPMTVDTVFDLASLTKPIATATSILQLVERGQVRLEAPIAEYLPEFGVNGKHQITVEQLLIHQSGLIADNALDDYRSGAEAAWQKISQLKPAHEPGSKFVYSDVGFMVLGELVRRVSGRNVAEFSRSECFEPLGMKETGYLPAEPLRIRAAPTEKRDGQWIQGEVHDPRAFLLGGIAGHAGLFSTASDLAIYASAMANQGRSGDRQIMKEETWSLMTKPRPVSSGLRALGWDVKTGYSNNRGKGMSEQAFGHGGFTGTGIWIDPATKLFVIFLSNRVHPDGKGLVNPLIGQIGTIAAEAKD